MTIENCVILAAGLGSRLRNLTNNKPKCLIEVNGISILEHTLASLESAGIKNTVIVVGYLANAIKVQIGYCYERMAVSYITNEIYSQTNSMYSAWLARETLEKGSLLIEGDTIFDERLIRKALESDESRSYWVLDQFRPEHDGCLCIGKPNSPIQKQMIVREKLPEYKDTFFKSTGVLKLTSEYGKLFSKWLTEAIRENDVNIYYDLVIGRHLEDYPLYILDVTGVRWFEIDTQEDLLRAEEIFAV